MKKFLALLLAVVMVMGLVACGNDALETTAPPANGTEPAGTTAPPVESTPNAEVPTLKWMMVGSGKPANYDAWAANLNAYLEEKIGVHVEVECVGWGDWDQTRNMTVSTNGQYDIMFTNNGTYANDVNMGAFMDITDLVATAAPGLVELIPAAYWDACKVNGKLYAVPTYKDSSSTQYFVVDEDIADATGLDYKSVTTMEGMTPVLEAMQAIETENHVAGEPVFVLAKGGLDAIMGRNYDGLGAGLPAIGVNYHNGEAKVVSVFEQDDILADLNTLRSWFEAGYINSDAAILEEAPTYRAVFVAQGWSGAAETSWGNAMNAYAIQWGPTVLSNDTVQGSMNCIAASCKYPEKALQLLELVNTDSYVRDALYYGLEGDNFEYTADGKVHKLNADWTMAGYTQGTFFNVSLEDTATFNQWDEVKALNEAAVPSPALGFTFDTTNVADDIAACKAIFEEHRAVLMTGTADPADTIAAMLDAMRASGLDGIIAEAQAQLDAWVAAK